MVDRPKQGAADRTAAKTERRAEALRRNLVRRKDQARARAERTASAAAPIAATRPPRRSESD
ncbi:MAG: hypothetical protein FJX46_02835 [Alphaproteobacteria bacterium]|nr:hypothetical protein [Alphaproteobacteria bacterium]